MKLQKAILVLFILILFPFQYGFSCSMYKITLGDKTIVGCNEDAWRLTPHIWFENPLNSQLYGAAFTGSRFDGNNGYAPQSGMNEKGLTFSRLASYMPDNSTSRVKDRKKISNPTFYLKDILHTCKTVEEVKAYIEQYDHSYFIADVFIYIDKSGKYLVVEPYSMKIDSNQTYVLSNFCPSITSEVQAKKLQRYNNGVKFLNTKIDTSLSFCAALSDTMHVCRNKLGDGTLTTSIWDLKNGLVNLYFYHQYEQTVQFNIKDELAKGNHIIAIQSLFSVNQEFEKLATYITPFNTDPLRIALVFVGLFLLILSVLFTVTFFIRKEIYSNVKFAFIFLDAVLSYYMFVLATNMGIYYFDAPYKVTSFAINVSSYTPLLLLVGIFPLLVYCIKIFREKKWSIFSKFILTLNILLYLILLSMFAYWELFILF